MILAYSLPCQRLIKVNVITISRTGSLYQCKATGVADVEVHFLLAVRWSHFRSTGGL
jgi:hypothetical protein